MAADVVPYFRPQFLDLDGKPLAGGKVWTYKAGTSSLLATYQDAEYTPNSNPIILDSSGCADIFIGLQALKFMIYDQDDVLIKTVDGVTGASGTAVGIQTVVPITTNGSQTRFPLGVDAELVQNVTAVVVPSSGSRIVYMTTEYELDGQDLVFDSAPPVGAGEIRVGHTRSISTSGLSDGIVSTSKLQNLAVTNAKLALNAVAAGNIQDGAVTGPKMADGIVSTAKLADLSVTTGKIANGAVTRAKIDDAVFGLIYDARNKIVNGDFRLWQRATSFAAVADLTNTADHWIYRKSGAMVHTVSQDSAAPTFAQAGELFLNSQKVLVTTTDTSIGSTDICYIGQAIEGFLFQSFAQKEFILHFWVNSSKTGTYCVSFGGATSSRVYVAEYQVLAANTWEKKSIVVPASPSGGSWDYTNGLGLGVSWILAAGSNSHITAGSWQNGSARAATANQVNHCDTNSATFYLTGVQLEVGNIAKAYDTRPLSVEMLLTGRRREVVRSIFHGYNPNVTASLAIGGSVAQKVDKRGALTAREITSSFVDHCTNPSISNNGTRVDVRADFSAAGAGAAYLETVSIIEAEIFF